MKDSYTLAPWLFRFDRQWAFLVSFLLYSPSLSAQDASPKFERLSINNGLSQGSINCISQDNGGFMWFGTQDGLNRYDGYRFKIFHHDPLDSNSIPNEWIHTLYTDRKGTLWVGTDGGGLCKWISSANKFENYQIPGIANSHSSYPVNAIYEDQNGQFWIGTDGDGLVKFDRDQNLFVHFVRDLTNTNSLSSNSISCLAEDADGVLWVGTNGGGLDCFDPEKGTFTHYRKENGLKDEIIQSIKITRNGFLFVGTETGLHFFKKSIGRFFFITLQESIYKKNKYSVSSILEDHTGNIWIGTYGNGFFRFDQSSQKLISHHSNWPEDNSPADEFIISIYEDRSGLLWIGTDGSGVNKLIRNSNNFFHYRRNDRHTGNLSENYVFAFCEDIKGNLWVGTYGGGLNKLDTINQTLVHFTEVPGSANSLSSNNILSLLPDSQGNLWIGTADGGLNKLKPDLQQFRQYKKDASSGLKTNVIRALASASNGKIWLGTDAGLYLFDPVTEKFIEYAFRADHPNGLSDNTIWCLYTDRNGILWIGTRNGGLNRFDPNTQQFTVYRNNAVGSNTLPANGIWSIYEDHAGRFWIGTAGGGLILFGRNSITFTRYSEKDGLPNQVIYGILEDDQGNLWLSTNNGISKFDPIGMIFKNYDVYDGLQSNEFNSGAYYRNRKGQLLFGGVNGFNLFNPTEIKDNTYIPPVVLTSFRKFDRSVVLNNWELPEINLTYKENVFSFEFASLDYTRPEKNQYAYKMEGFDSDWIYSGTKHDVTYTNLDHGSYTFKVKASNSDNIWNENGLTAKINIYPPFWKTWWFRLISFTGLIFVLYQSYIYRTRKINKRNKDLELIIAERTRNLEKANAELKLANEKIMAANETKSRFLANMSHELRTPLNSIIGFSDLLMQGVLGPIPPEQKQSVGAISTSSKNLLKLINDVLDLSKIEAGKMALKRSAVHLDEITQSVRHLMMPLFEKKMQSFDIRLPEPSPIIPADENKLRQVLINLLSNASKFTPQYGKISLLAQRVSYNSPLNDYLEIRITDNGKGIPSEELESVFEEFRQGSDNSENQGTGLGLALTKRIVDLHGGKIWAESDGKSGSEFIIHLPLNEKPLS